MFEVAGKEVGGDRAFVVAEIGSNHQGDIDTAKRLIDIAALSGCDAVKTQIRTNRELYTQAYYDRPYDSENAFGPTYGAHREFLELSIDQHDELAEHARGLGLVYFATAFDTGAVEMCQELGLAAIKIASGSVSNHPLLIKAARTGVPIFMSTGGCTVTDVDNAMDALWAFNKNICLLQATASYPCAWEELDLAVIGNYAHRYPKCVIGLSSHVAGIADGPPAYVLGARVFEKHVTANRSMKGTDHAFSLEPAGIAKFVRDLRRIEVALGDGRKKRHMSEVEPIAKMSGSVYFSRALKAGHTIASQDLCIRSPGGFIPPYEITKLVGLELLRDVGAEEACTWEIVLETQTRRTAV